MNVSYILVKGLIDT